MAERGFSYMLMLCCIISLCGHGIGFSDGYGLKKWTLGARLGPHGGQQSVTLGISSTCLCVNIFIRCRLSCRISCLSKQIFLRRCLGVHRITLLAKLHVCYTRLVDLGRQLVEIGGPALVRCH